MLDGINGVEKRQRVFRFVYYSVVFSFLFLFFAKIHPIMIFDSDDWGVAMFRRRALPLWGIWNPARILPEVLMPVCSSIGAHILYPLLGDFSWSTTLVYAAVVSGFIVMYLYVMERVLTEIIHVSGTVAIWINALILLMHFWCFRVKSQGNQHLFYGADACIYFYYIVPAMLNASLVMLMEMNWKGFRLLGNSEDHIIEGLIVLGIYFAVFSNLFASQILAIYVGTRILLSLWKLFSNKKSIDIKKNFLKKYIWEIIIFIVWIISLPLEMSGGRASDLLANKSMKDAFWNICLQISSVWKMTNKGFVFFSGACIVIAIAVFLGKKDKDQDSREVIKLMARCIMCFILSAIYTLLLCVVTDKILNDSVILMGTMFWLLLIVAVSIAYILKECPIVVAAMPLMLIIVIFEIDTVGITFREPNYGGMPAWKCAAINKALLEQVIEAEKKEQDEIQLYVPKFAHESNWPMANYLVYDMTRTLSKYGLISEAHSGTVIPIEDFDVRFLNE